MSDTLPLIALSNIVFARPGQTPVLHKLSLALAHGERLCIAGPNGAGKTTLLHIIVGLLKPQAGQLLAFGQERRNEPDFHDVRRLAGLVFQDPDDQLFCPTVADDIAFGPLNLGKSRDEAMAIVDAVLQQLDILALKDRITHQLSGGEKRLVTLATVLAMEPRVLLLDEPSNALDEARWAQLVAILKALPQAMIVVSHDTALRQQVATRSLRLTNGQLTPFLET